MVWRTHSVSLVICPLNTEVVLHRQKMRCSSETGTAQTHQTRQNCRGLHTKTALMGNAASLTLPGINGVMYATRDTRGEGESAQTRWLRLVWPVMTHVFVMHVKNFYWIQSCSCYNKNRHVMKRVKIGRPREDQQGEIFFHIFLHMLVELNETNKQNNHQVRIYIPFRPQLGCHISALLSKIKTLLIFKTILDDSFS